MRVLPVASVVTQKTICEFDLLKKSLEQYHECHWVLSCDNISFLKYKEESNVECLNIIKTDDCDHNIGTEKQKDAWMDVMMTKFDASKLLIENFGSALFLDSDMIFVNEIEPSIMDLFKNKNVDAAICQHMTNNWQVEAKHGLYNGGMFHIKNLDFLEQWVKLSKNYKDYGFYFEQQPLEYVQRNFVSLNLPINYNIGWWRFNNQNTKNRLELLGIEDEKIMFGSRPAVNFHVHTLREIGYQNFGQFLVDKIKSLMEQTNNDKYKELKNDF